MRIGDGGSDGALTYLQNIGYIVGLRGFDDDRAKYTIHCLVLIPDWGAFDVLLFHLSLEPGLFGETTVLI